MNILLIDKRVSRYEDIVAAIDPALAVGIVFDYFEDTFDTLKARMSELGVTPSTGGSVGLIQHNYRAPMFSMLASADVSPVAQVAAQDPDLGRWTQFRDFIVWCKTAPEIGASHFDMMACALYSNKDWKYVIDTLTLQTGVTVRASTDNTGSATLGGNWFLESHTGINLKGVYFTELIEEYRGILFLAPYNSREYSTKGFATGAVVAWGIGSGYEIIAVPSDLSSNVVTLYSTLYAFAALKTDGSVVAWGDSYSGGDSSAVASDLSSNVVAVYSTSYAFAALKTDGSVVTWGDPDSGGNSSISTYNEYTEESSYISVANSLTSGVVAVYSTQSSFAALTSNGAVVAWGDSGWGGTTPANVGSGVVAVYSNSGSFAALKSDGSVVAWGNSDGGGLDPGINSGVVAVYSNYSAFAALKTDGSVVAWGGSDSGGTAPSSVTAANSGVIAVYSTEGAFAALKNTGRVITWGRGTYLDGMGDMGVDGGDSSEVASDLSSNVVAVYSTTYAFAALKSDGSIVAWGGSTYGGTAPSTVTAANSGVVSVYSTDYSFAALKSDGSIITWGDSNAGGDSSSVASDLSNNVVAVYSSQLSMAALKSDGGIVTWGNSDSGGTNPGITYGAVAIYSTGGALAAITAVPGLVVDLSMSYYTDMDRYDILRKKENRRRVDLYYSNNNVFTLSAARDIQSFNPTIPASITLGIIVPDYFASSSYSITSTATIPNSAGSFIVACDEGEPVTIAGATYVNFGSYIYKRETDNTYTKTTSVTINSTPYTLYGGDGVNSSGIALVYSTSTPPPIEHIPIVITLTGSVETFSEGSDRRLAFVSILASTLSISENQIVIISVRPGSIIVELEFVQILSSDVSPAEAMLRLRQAMAGGSLESIGAISLSIGGQVTSSPTTVKAGIMPPHLYPASSDSMFSTGRNTFARTSVPANAATITAAEATKRKQIYDPHNASSRMERLKMQAIGQSSMRVKPGEELRFKAPNVNDARDAVRRMRSGGYVAPAKSWNKPI